MIDPAKVMLRIPHGRDNPDPAVTKWLIWLVRACPEMDIDLHHCSAGPAEARCDIVREEFLPSCYEWLWMVDSDTVPKRDLSILDYDYPILFGWYLSYFGDKTIGPIPSVYAKHPKIPQLVTAYPYRKWPKEGEVLKCYAAGTGCMLLHRNVLEAFGEEEPFQYGRYDGKRLGEDFTFCIRANYMGLGPIRFLRSYRCTHYRVINLDSFEADVAVARYGK